MNTKLLAIVFSFCFSFIQAQTINLAGTSWSCETESASKYGPSWEEWVFNADGTRNTKGQMSLQYPIAGYSVKFDVYQDRTEDKWEINNNELKHTSIPLRFSKLEIKNLQLDRFSSAEKSKIKAEIPKFRNQIMSEAKNDWQQKMVGNTYTYTITSFNPAKMTLYNSRTGKYLILIRNTANMSKEEKIAYEKELAKYDAEEKARERQKNIELANEKKAAKIAKEEAEKRAYLGWHELDPRYPKNIKIKKVRINKSDCPGTYCCVFFSRYPNGQNGKKIYAVNLYTGGILDNAIKEDWMNAISRKQQTKVEKDWYEYEFSDPVYFQSFQNNVDFSMIKVYTE